MATVLDASAVFAVLQKERGAELVMACLHDALLCAVNYAEAVSKLAERSVPADLAAAAIQKLGAAVVAFDGDLAARAGALRARTRHLGLSLPDRACLALAERERAPVMTGNPKWARIDIGVPIRLIR